MTARRATNRSLTSIRDDDEFAHAVVLYVCDRAVAGAELGFAERVVDLVNNCEYRLLRGGLSGFLWNTDEYAQTFDALTTIGSTRVERILRHAVTLVDALPPSKNVFDAATSLAPLADELDGAAGISEIGTHLHAWIASHRSLFAPD